MRIQQMFPNRYTAGADLHGKPVVTRIREVMREQMKPGGGPVVNKWVVYFDGLGKGVVLSRELAEQIADAVGSDDTADWPGKRLTLYPEMLLVGGRALLCIKACAVGARETAASKA